MTIQNSGHQGEQTHIEYMKIVDQDHKIDGVRLYPKEAWDNKFMPIVKFFAWLRGSTCDVKINGKDYVLVRQTLRDLNEVKGAEKKHFSDAEVKTILQHVMGKSGVRLTSEPLDIKQLTKAVANLKNDVEKFWTSEQLMFLDREEIEGRGAFCLNDCPDKPYHGIAASNSSGQWRLHLIPGGRLDEIAEEDYDQLMSAAISKLKELGIVPVAFVEDGRHPGMTAENFKSWQARNQT